MGCMESCMTSGRRNLQVESDDAVRGMTTRPTTSSPLSAPAHAPSPLRFTVVVHITPPPTSSSELTKKLAVGRNNTRSDECPICLDALHAFTSTTEVCSQCKYAFHPMCIAKWFSSPVNVKRSRSECPMCRTPWGHHDHDI